MSVSVVIPTKNRARYLRDAIDSALMQSVDCEVLVVDAASTDSTELLCTGYQGLRYHRLPYDPGAYDTWRVAAQLATGKHMVLLHDDDILEPRFVQHCRDALTSDSAYTFTNAQIFWPDGRTQLNLPRNAAPAHLTSGGMVEALTSIGLTISPCCALFRREDVLRCLQVNPLPMPEPPTVGHDLLLMLLPLLRYPAVRYIDEPLVRFRAHDQSYTINAMSDPDKHRRLLDDYAKTRRYFQTVRQLWQ